MMDQSRRARRMERHHKIRKQPILNLVSLMDIFTILVFFLLVSSSNTQDIPSNKDLKLPTSVATTSPKDTTVIAITATQILVQGRKVAEIAQELSQDDELIQGLKDELLFQAEKSANNNQTAKSPGLPITIMGDENISYALLRKVLATCREANYTRIAFAAVQKAKDAP